MKSEAATYLWLKLPFILELHETLTRSSWRICNPIRYTGFLFVQVGSLKKHIELVHSGSVEHNCKQCTFTTSSIKYLKMHVKKVHAPPSHDGGEMGGGGGSSLKCDQCDFTTPKFSILKSHVEMNHEAIRMPKFKISIGETES